MHTKDKESIHIEDMLSEHLSAQLVLFLILYGITGAAAFIATRNFILTADQLRKKTGVKDGGEVYLFGAKMKGQGDVLLKCQKWN